MMSIRRCGSPIFWHECWTIRQNGSATSCHGTGAQNAVPLPDTPLGIETGEFVELPRRALVDLGQLIWAADRSPSFGD
jgi:hypothetical protein